MGNFLSFEFVKGTGFGEQKTKYPTPSSSKITVSVPGFPGANGK